MVAKEVDGVEEGADEPVSVVGSAAAPKPADGPEAVLAHRLCRWIILQPQVEWSVFDRMEKISGLLKEGVAITPPQKDFMEKVLQWAEKLGFSADIDPEGETIAL